MSDADDVPQQKRMIPDGRVLTAFMQDWNLVTIIRGPWGSGKSVGCVGKLFMAASMQAPNRQGVRRSRWAVVRDSYPNLQETTIKTWLEWFPESVYGDMRKQRPYQHVIRVPGALHNGKPTKIEMEVIFLALEEEDDRKKLLSLELTGAWVNEARELRKSIIDDLIGRVSMGRFPPAMDGGATWVGVFMDTNAPAETHWLPMMMGEVPVPEDLPEEERAALVKPDNWSYYVQPGALLEQKDEAGKIAYVANPAAENIRYLRGGHEAYLSGIGGKSRSWIRVNYCNKLGEVVAGKPVWPNFDRARHVAPKDIPIDPGTTLYVAIDSTGRNPAAVFGQAPRRHWNIVGELVAREINMDVFAPLVKRKIEDLLRPLGLTYQQMPVAFYRDPHMEQSQIDGRTVDQIFAKYGMRLIPAPGQNAIKLRLDTVETIIDNFRMTISPSCRMLIGACEGGYRYRKLQVAGDVYEPEPDKRRCGSYADVADALQYLMLGAGEGRAMVRGNERALPVKTAVGYRPGQDRNNDRWNERRAWSRG